jgi:hypothetical protein
MLHNRFSLPEFEILGFINFHPEVAEADRLGKSVFEMAPQAVEDARIIKKELDRIIRSKA